MAHKDSPRPNMQERANPRSNQCSLLFFWHLKYCTKRICAPRTDKSGSWETPKKNCSCPPEIADSWMLHDDIASCHISLHCLWTSIWSKRAKNKKATPIPSFNNKINFSSLIIWEINICNLWLKNINICHKPVSNFLSNHIILAVANWSAL